MCRKSLHYFLLLLFLLALSRCLAQKHTSNHAVIVSSSRYWFNYRHVVNALSIYQLCKSRGIPDENIILMLADELPANARNPKRNFMSAGPNNLYSDDIEIDYRGDEVTVDNLVKVLLGRHNTTTTTTTRALHSNQDSHILIYWTGHGGDGFFKFQDVEEITSTQIARLFQQMHVAKRYKEILFIADTCQAFTLGDSLGEGVSNVYMVGSSLRNENSYAHHSDSTLGLSVIERYTHALSKFLQKRDLKKLSLKQGLVDHLRFQEQRAHVGYREDGCERKFRTVPMSDFFANVQSSSPMKPLYADRLEEYDESSAWVAGLESDDGVARFGSESDESSVENDTCTETEDDPPGYQGIEPSNPLFIAALLLFVGAIVLASTQT